MITELETAIVDRLKAPLLALGVQVLPLPESKELPIPTRKGQVLVAYFGSQFADPDDYNGGQIRNAQVELIVQVLGLRSHQGAYPIIDKIHSLLTRFVPIGGGAMFPKSDRLLSQDDSIWTYSIVYNVEEQHF